MLFIRSLLFNIFFYSGVILVFFFAIPTLVLPNKLVLILGKLLGYYIVFLSRLILGTKTEIIGIENIPKDKKYFFASAHQSLFETFALQKFINYPVFILKKELLKIPLFGLYLKKINSISIVRDTTTKDNVNFFENVANIVENQERPLLIFPQGTRLDINDRSSFKKGAGRIYEALGITCVPIALNTGKFWPKKSFIKYPGKINISFLKPIAPGLDRNNFIKQLEEVIYKEVDNIS